MSKLDKLIKEYEKDVTSNTVGYVEYSTDSFIAGYTKAVELAKQWIKNNYWTCSNAEEYSEDFVKFMKM